MANLSIAAILAGGLNYLAGKLVGTGAPVSSGSVSGTYALNCPSNGASICYDLTLTGATTFTLGGGGNTGGSGVFEQSVRLVLRQGGSGGFLPTLPSNVKWAGGTPPTPNTTAGKIDIYVFRTTDGGATWLAGN